MLAYTDAQQALKRFEQGGVDLVLTDLIMRGIDGSKLIDRVKAISPGTPSILVSGKVRIYERDNCADVFLAKGMDVPANGFPAGGAAALNALSVLYPVPVVTLEAST